MDGGSGHLGKVHQCAVAPHFISCDADGELRCDDFERRPIQRLRGSIGDACCECELKLGKCIAAALEAAGDSSNSIDGASAYSIKYKDWSDPDLLAIGRRGNAAKSTKTKRQSSMVCGPKSPSLFRRAHGFIAGAGLLFANTTGVASAIESVTKDFLLTAEDRTIEAMKVRSHSLAANRPAIASLYSHILPPLPASVSMNGHTCTTWHRTLTHTHFCSHVARKRTQATAEHNVDEVLHAVDDAIDHARHRVEDGTAAADNGGGQNNMGFALFDIASSAASSEDDFISKIDAYDNEAAGVIQAFSERARENGEKAKKFMEQTATAFEAARAWMEQAKKAWDPTRWSDLAAEFSGKSADTEGNDSSSSLSRVRQHRQHKAAPEESDEPGLSFFEKLPDILSHIDPSIFAFDDDAP